MCYWHILDVFAGGGLGWDGGGRGRCLALAHARDANTLEMVVGGVFAFACTCTRLMLRERLGTIGLRFPALCLHMHVTPKLK